jgi:REP element-mobilizing transposase RayT
VCVSARIGNAVTHTPSGVAATLDYSNSYITFADSNNLNRTIMANTYSQMYVHLVFAVKSNHLSLIKEAHRDTMEKYICGIISNCKSKPLAIYCNPDHTHLFIGLHPSISVSEIVNKIKVNSSRFYHTSMESNRFFAWQDGYGVFSNSHSQIDAVCHYIKQQKEHHRKHTFQEEYLDMLEKSKIEYDPNYLFDFS